MLNADVSRNVIDIWIFLFKVKKRTSNDNQGFHSKMGVLFLISHSICKADQTETKVMSAQKRIYNFSQQYMVSLLKTIKTNDIIKQASTAKKQLKEVLQ